jgi:hypothetical protein
MALDLAYFEANPDAFEALSDEDRMALANGDTIEGEIQGESPDAGDQEETTDEAQEEVEAEEAPAVLARDGKHTIPFEELQSAREQARYWQAQAEQAQAAASQSQAQQSDEPAKAVDLKELRRQIREAWMLDDGDTADSLQAEADAEILRQAEARALNVVTQREAEYQRQASERAVIAAEAAAHQAYPFLNHNLPNADWKAIAQVKGLVQMYMDNGASPVDAINSAVADVAPQYVKTSPQAVQSDQSVQSRAAAAIAKAKTKTPISMSSIPSSANPPMDETAAINEMNVESLHDKFMNLPRERILELMAKQM